MFILLAGGSFIAIHWMAIATAIRRTADPDPGTSRGLPRSRRAPGSDLTYLDAS
jgi:hypothetical protein